MRTHANRGQSPLRLQVDASALHVLLIGRSHGQLQRRCSRRRSICPSALLTFDATDSCSRALDDISSYRCAPAYWRAVAGCSHPAVAASLLLAAAHLSGISEGDTVEDAAVLEQGKKLGGDSYFIFAPQYSGLSTIYTVRRTPRRLSASQRPSLAEAGFPLGSYSGSSGSIEGFQEDLIWV